MTAQMADEFRYEGELYSLVGLDGEGLYTPESFGMQPFSSCTACWRGFVMYYDCVDNELLLDAMDVNVHEAGPINGVVPSASENFFKFRYNKLHLKTSFTGTILLAKDFIQEMYVHMGFQRPMAFKTVLELHIEDGEITKVDNLSELMALRRKENPDRGAMPRSPSEVDVSEWIGDTFSLDYEKPKDE
ncbi:MAG: hypothetical protein P1Q69_09085 [Candidatus Thorarchaeota archaeon]|nr:hypothetical protein [Candidatus Thorarchaeota archaeon]